MDDTLNQAKTVPVSTEDNVGAPTRSPSQDAITRRTIGILTALAEGVDPATGEVFPDNCPYHSPEIVRALYGAIRVLENGAARRPERPVPRPRDGTPTNAGKPWSAEEDRQLLVEFDAGKSLKECAVLHQRTYAGIEARLEKLGRLDASDRTTSRRVPPRHGTARETLPHRGGGMTRSG